MTRYQKLFKTLTLRKEGAFVPFVSLGDPDFHFSIKIINTLIESGSDALELGIPFSDPLADGKNIQNAFHRALDALINVDKCFKIINIIRQYNKNIPIGLLTYSNLIFKNKIDTFYARCAQSNIDSILIADLPIEESAPFRQAAINHKIKQVFICPVNADNNFLKKISMYSQAYIYLASRAGVTGNENYSKRPLQTLIKDLNKYRTSPILQGFGIYTPKQAKTALQLGTSGIITGSSIANIIEENIKNKKLLLEKLNNFVHSMKNAMK